MCLFVQMPLDVLWVSIILNCNLRNKISVRNDSRNALFVLNLPKNIANTINFNLGCFARSKEIAEYFASNFAECVRLLKIEFSLMGIKWSVQGKALSKIGAGYLRGLVPHHKIGFKLLESQHIFQFSMMLWCCDFSLVWSRCGLSQKLWFLQNNKAR